jgi:hypothetical protein
MILIPSLTQFRSIDVAQDLTSIKKTGIILHLSSSK